MIVPLNELETALHELQQNKNLVKVLVSPEIGHRIMLQAGKEACHGL